MTAEKADEHKTKTASILIVDDEKGPRESLKMILGPQYRLMTAVNGAQALEEIEREAPDLVISDIRMPGMSGTELLHRIKDISPATPVILITGYANLQSAQEAVRGRAFDYIDKPFDVKELQALVEKALAESQEKKRHQRLVQQLHSWSRDLQDQISELDQKAAVADLSAEIIHDLNNPMTVLKGYIGLLEDSIESSADTSEKDLQEFLEIVKSQVDKCISLTRNFLDFSRQADRNWEKTDINSLIQDTLFVLRIRMTKSNVESETSLQSDLPEVWVMPTALQQMIYNLLANAVDAISEKGDNDQGLIHIDTRLRENEPLLEEHPETVEITIKDNGPGISPERMERIFTPFFTTKEKGKGTGLGLSICKRVADKHQGQLKVNSEIGEGTTFTILLPLRRNRPESTDED